MSGYRLSAQEREMHDDGRCPDLCPACARIETAQQAAAPDDRDYLIVNYPQGWGDAPC